MYIQLLVLEEFAGASDNHMPCFNVYSYVHIRVGLEQRAVKIERACAVW